MNELIAVTDQGPVLSETEANGALTLLLLSFQDGEDVDAIVGALREGQGYDRRESGKVVTADAWGLDVAGFQCSGPLDYRRDTQSPLVEAAFTPPEITGRPLRFSPWTRIALRSVVTREAHHGLLLDTQITKVRTQPAYLGIECGNAAEILLLVVW